MIPHYSPEQIQAIAAKHKLSRECAPMKPLGVVNDIWSIGTEFVLRIPTDVEYAGSMYAESVAAPFAYHAGILTPELVVFDDDRDIVPVPLAVSRRVDGIAMGECARCLSFESFAYHHSAVIDALAEQLVRLHQTVAPQDPQSLLNPWWLDDPNEQISESLENSRVTLQEAKWLDRLAEGLFAAFSYDPAGPCDQAVFVHHDVHPWNILVTEDQDSIRFMSLLDWGNATLGDPAVDFCGFPLWALPPLLDSYRLAGGVAEEGIEGRILWVWLAHALMEPSFLDEKVFNRHWWRLPEDGVTELQYRLLQLPDRWRRWLPG